MSEAKFSRTSLKKLEFVMILNKKMKKNSSVEGMSAVTLLKSSAKPVLHFSLYADDARQSAQAHPEFPYFSKG